MRRRYMVSNETFGYANAIAGDILCSDLSIVTPANYTSSGKTAIGVVYNNTSNKLRVVSLMSTSYPNYQIRAFGEMGNNISGITDCITEQEAISDLNGKTNTQAIVTIYGNNGEFIIASVFCNKYTTTGTSAGSWYCPSAGELYLLSQVNNTVTSTRQLLSLSALTYIISSSEYDSDYCWYGNVSDGCLYSDITKADSIMVIPFLSITY